MKEYQKKKKTPRKFKKPIVVWISSLQHLTLSHQQNFTGKITPHGAVNK